MSGIFVCYLSLSTMLLSSIYAAMLVLLHACKVLHCINIYKVFIHSPIDEQLSSYQFAAVMLKLL